MDYLINHFTAWHLCFIFMGVCSAASILCLWLFRKRYSYARLKAYREVGSIMFGIISLVYSLILAFVIVAVWEDYEEVNNSVIREAAKLSDIRFHAEELDSSLSQRVTVAVAAYAGQEVKDQWYNLSDIQRSDPTLSRLRHQLLDYYRQNRANKEEVDAINKDIEDVMEIRYTLLGSVYSHVPFLVWAVLIAGSLIVIFFSYFFITESDKLHYLFSTILVGMVAMCLFLLYMLDHPLCGTSAVSPAPLQHLAAGKEMF
jgi:hypothetical protein